MKSALCIAEQSVVTFEVEREYADVTVSAVYYIGGLTKRLLARVAGLFCVRSLHLSLTFLDGGSADAAQLVSPVEVSCLPPRCLSILVLELYDRQKHSMEA